MTPSIDALYREHSGSVLNHAKRISDNNHYAEDAAQDAWIALMGAKGVNNARRWLITAAKREYWRYMRREARKVSVGDHEELDTPCEGEQEANCERKRIASALDGLMVPIGKGSEMQNASEPMKHNLGLMFMGYDSGEIAKMRGVSSAGVRDNLARGIKALKAHWGIDE